MNFCKRCGYCCTLVPKISFTEMLKIMLKGYKGFTEKDGKGRRCLKLVNGDCYFLARHGDITRCKIYDSRPQVCRDFPYKGATDCNVDKRSFKERIIS